MQGGILRQWAFLRLLYYAGAAKDGSNLFPLGNAPFWSSNLSEMLIQQAVSVYMVGGGKGNGGRRERRHLKLASKYCTSH